MKRLLSAIVELFDPAAPRGLFKAPALALFLAIIMVVSFSVQSQAAGFSYQVKGLEKTHWYLPGVQTNGKDATGGTLDAFYGPFGQLKYGDYVLAELAIPAGLGTRFGNINSTEGDKTTIHVGAAICHLDRTICESGTYSVVLDNLFAPDEKEGRFQVNVDLTGIPNAIGRGTKALWDLAFGK